MHTHVHTHSQIPTHSHTSPHPPTPHTLSHTHVHHCLKSRSCMCMHVCVCVFVFEWLCVSVRFQCVLPTSAIVVSGGDWCQCLHTHTSEQIMNGPHYDEDVLDLNGYGFAGDESLEGDDVMLPSLADLSPTTDSRYQSHTLHCDSNGEFGFTLRHFSIQPNAAGMVSGPQPLKPGFSSCTIQPPKPLYPPQPLYPPPSPKSPCYVHVVLLMS